MVLFWYQAFLSVVTSQYVDMVGFICIGVAVSRVYLYIIAHPVMWLNIPGFTLLGRLKPENEARTIASAQYCARYICTTYSYCGKPWCNQSHVGVIYWQLYFMCIPFCSLAGNMIGDEGVASLATRLEGCTNPHTLKWVSCLCNENTVTFNIVCNS